MQPLPGTYGYQNRYNRDGSIASGTPYTEAEVVNVLLGPRTEVFLYILQRLVGGTWDEANQKIAGGAWTDIADITNLVHSCTLRYDWTTTNVMGHASFEIVDAAGIINFQTDVIRCYHMVLMPDGNYVSWIKGTYHVPSPVMPFDGMMLRKVETDDSLRTLVDDKLTDYFQVPSPDPGGVFDDGDAISWATKLIQDHYPLAGVDLGGPSALRVPASEPITFAPGTSYLDVVNELLTYCNFDHVRANVTGSYVSQPYVAASSLPIEYEYVADGASIIVRGASSSEQDYWNAPNRWLRIKSLPSGDRLRSQLTLTDVNNPLSTTARGRIVTDFEFSNAPDEATLDDQVRKLYEEGQHVAKTVKIQTPLNPHEHRDIGALSWPTQTWGAAGNGVFILKSWTFPMVAGGKMEHTYKYIATEGNVGTVIFGLASITGSLAQPGVAPSGPLAPTVTPPVHTLTTTTFAPTVALTNNQIVTPAVRALTTTGLAPDLGQGVVPTTAALVTATFAPAIGSGIYVTPGVDALATSSFAPTVSLSNNQLATPATIALATSTFAPQVNLAVLPSTAALTTSTFAAAANIGIYVTPGVVALTTSAFAPTISLSNNQLVTPGVVALATTIYAPYRPYTEEAIADGALVLWLLDETSGTNNVDSSGNSRDATLSGTYTQNVAGVGHLTPATLFNGGASVKASESALQITDDLTIEAWIYDIASTGTTQIYVSKNDGSTTAGSSYGLLYDSPANKYGFSGWVSGTEQVCEVSGRPPNTAWTHVVATRKRSTGAMLLYVNGSQVASTTGSTGALNSNGSAVGIGRSGSPGSNLYANARITGVAIYNTVLSADRIATHYAAATA